MTGSKLAQAGSAPLPATSQAREVAPVIAHNDLGMLRLDISGTGIPNSSVNTSFFVRARIPSEATRYESMDAAVAMNTLAHRHISQTFTDPLIGAVASELSTDMRNRHIQCNQYHAGPHAQEVGEYLIRLSQLAGLPQSDMANLKRIVVASFHDLANGTAPRAPGTDESNAAIKFLKFRFDAAQGNRNLANGSCVALGLINTEQALEITAEILGTVFRDRFASAEKLTQLDYVKVFAKFLSEEGAQYGIQQSDLEQFAHHRGVSPYTPNRLAEALAIAMTSPEAVALKHADIAGSLSEIDALKYILVNAQEDSRRTPPQRQSEPEKYIAGFEMFLTGKFCPTSETSPMADAIRKDPGSIFVGLNNVVAEFGRDKFKRWQKATNEIYGAFAAAPSGNILKQFHAMINAGNDVMNMTIEQFRDRLLADGFDLASYSNLRNIDPQYKDKTIPALLGHEVNNLLLPDFANRTYYISASDEKRGEILSMGIPVLQMPRHSQN
jgi:hypothetical protein